MANHPAIAAGRTAVITGGASGIGLAAAKRYASLGMNVAIADLNSAALSSAEAAIRAAGAPKVFAAEVDVSEVAAVEYFRDRVYNRLGEVGILMKQRRDGRWRLGLRELRRLAEGDWHKSLGRDQRDPGVCAEDDPAGHAGRDRQHRIEAGHYHAAGRHRL